jgi:hypothetical protein
MCLALAIGHKSNDGVDVDVIRGWRGSRGTPVQIEPTLDAIAELSREYNRAPVVTDQFASEPIRQALAGRGVRVLERPWTNDTKAGAVSEARRLLQTRLLGLLDHPDSIRELIQLEQHLLPSGRPRIAAPSGSNDDYAMALLALVLEASRNPSHSRSVPFGAAA